MDLQDRKNITIIIRNKMGFNLEKFIVDILANRERIHELLYCGDISFLDGKPITITNIIRNKINTKTLSKVGTPIFENFFSYCIEDKKKNKIFIEIRDISWWCNEHDSLKWIYDKEHISIRTNTESIYSGNMQNVKVIFEILPNSISKSKLVERSKCFGFTN
jgi:hypothetical protein